VRDPVEDVRELVAEVHNQSSRYRGA
jgi:hypothetical protein